MILRNILKVSGILIILEIDMNKKGLGKMH